MAQVSGASIYSSWCISNFATNVGGGERDLEQNLPEISYFTY